MYQPRIRRRCSGESPPRPAAATPSQLVEALRHAVTLGACGAAATTQAAARRRRARADREPTVAPIRTAARRRRVSPSREEPSRAGASRRWSSSPGAAVCCAAPCGTRTGFRRWRGCTRFDTSDATRRGDWFDGTTRRTRTNPKTLESFRRVSAGRRDRTRRTRTRPPPPRATPPPRWRAREARVDTGPDAAADVLAIATARFPKRRFPGDVAVDRAARRRRDGPRRRARGATATRATPPRVASRRSRLRRRERTRRRAWKPSGPAPTPV